jgi:hypothetical protein
MFFFGSTENPLAGSTREEDINSAINGVRLILYALSKRGRRVEAIYIYVQIMRDEDSPFVSNLIVIASIVAIYFLFSQK